MTFKDENGAKIGQYVRTSRHGYVGRIYAKYHSYSNTKEPISWFVIQEPAIPKSAMKEPWYSVLVKGGGSILICESDIAEILEPVELNNVWESYYFDVTVKNDMVILERGEKVSG